MKKFFLSNVFISVLIAYFHITLFAITTVCTNCEYDEMNKVFHTLTA